MRHKKGRIYFILAIIFISAATILARLFFIQVSRADFYQALVENQYLASTVKEMTRGSIYTQDKDNNLHALAVNKEVYTIYAVPKEINDPQTAASKLSSVLDTDRDVILNKINKEDDPFEILKIRADDKLAALVKELELPGIYSRLEFSRFYPANNLASQLLGFVSYRQQQPIGQYGLEEYYDDLLIDGQASKMSRLKSKLLDKLKFWESTDSKEQNNPAGADLILTVDFNIQTIIEKELADLVDKWEADGGSIVIMDPKTGRILAMVSYPNYNPNSYNEVGDIGIFKNPVNQVPFEPGSIIKPFTMAAALEDKLITPKTIYYDEGSIQVKDRIIRNYDGKKRGYQTMTQVLENSLNTGAVFVVQKLSFESFRNYISAFGFGEKTGIDLVGETKGNTDNLKKDSEVHFATASFGQGISVTPIEVVAAIGAIANEGKMMKPYLVDKIIYPDGTEEKIESESIGQPISTLTANQVTAMMVSVMDVGLDKRANLEEYFVAGKTGTAQISKKDGLGYETEKTIHSFIGFAPAYHPEFVIFMKLDRPEVNYASNSLGTSFKKITERLLQYYRIPPER
jgi:cell division protein FtsI/penicillin-binding protein 2